MKDIKRDTSGSSMWIPILGIGIPLIVASIALLIIRYTGG